MIPEVVLEQHEQIFINSRGIYTRIRPEIQRNNGVILYLQNFLLQLHFNFNMVDKKICRLQLHLKFKFLLVKDNSNTPKSSPLKVLP